MHAIKWKPSIPVAYLGMHHAASRRQAVGCGARWCANNQTITLKVKVDTVKKLSIPDQHGVSIAKEHCSCLLAEASVKRENGHNLMCNNHKQLGRRTGALLAGLWFHPCAALRILDGIGRPSKSHLLTPQSNCRFAHLYMCDKRPITEALQVGEKR